MYQKLTVKEKLLLTYIKLLSKKPYNEITVSDLCKQANTARVSFYRSFNNINEVAELAVYEYQNKFREHLMPALFNASPKNRKQLINALESIKLTGNKLEPFLPVNKEYFDNLLKKNYDIIHKTEYKSIKEKYYPKIKLAIIFSIIKTWINYNYNESAEQIADIIIDTTKLY